MGFIAHDCVKSWVHMGFFIQYRFLLLFWALFCAGFSATASNQPPSPQALQTFRGQVVWVNDGDTLMVRLANRRKWRVRLADIDAPEKNQPYGEVAKKSLIGMVQRQDVRLECRKKTDQYGRKICKVFVKPVSCPACGQTLDAGLAMLTIGMAWWYGSASAEAHPQDRGAYAFAEKEARARKIGLWREANPVEPRLWRKLNPLY